MDKPRTRQNELLDKSTDVAKARRVSDESAGTPEVKRQGKGKRKTKRAKEKVRKQKQVEALMTNDVGDQPVVSQSQASGKTAIVSVTAGVYILPAPSGAKYVWSGPGAQVLVANEDVDFVMGKNGGGTRECCGAGQTRILFQLGE